MSGHPNAGDSDDTIATALAAMRLRYAENSQRLIAAFELVSDQLENAPESEDLLTSLRRELHRVRGTAGSLGFREAASMADAMEGLALHWSRDSTIDRARRSGIVGHFARALADAITVLPGAGVARVRRLVLFGLPDRTALELVAEALYRGIGVERLDDAATLRAHERGALHGIVALESAADVLGSVAAPLVLIRGEDANTHRRRAESALVVDAGTGAADIMDRLEGESAGSATGTVLLVDDDAGTLLLLRALAEDAGLTVESAHDARTFRERLDRLEPSVIVLDVQLPDGDGIALLHELRAHRERRDIPVLMLSGRTDAETRAAAFDAGAADYMVKPVVPAEFQQRVVQLIERQRTRRVSTGLHPSSGLAQPLRTMQELEARISGRGDTPWSIATVRPVDSAWLAMDVSAWQAECIRIERAVRAEGGFAGLVDEPGLAIAIPRPARDTETLLAALADHAGAGATPWHCGIVALDAMPAGTIRTLLVAAEDARIAARDAGQPVRIWTPEDADIAPDVIIVEDDPALGEMLAFALGARGWSHRTYVNGPDGLAALLRLRVRDRAPLVLLDVDLPGMDGHSLHERLRLERPGTFQVVFISLHASESDQLRALQGGALDYLSKPISLRVLMAKLAVWREQLRLG